MSSGFMPIPPLLRVPSNSGGKKGKHEGATEKVGNPYGRMSKHCDFQQVVFLCLHFANRAGCARVGSLNRGKLPKHPAFCPPRPSVRPCRCRKISARSGERDLPQALDLLWVFDLICLCSAMSLGLCSAMQLLRRNFLWQPPYKEYPLKKEPPLLAGTRPPCRSSFWFLCAVVSSNTDLCACSDSSFRRCSRRCCAEPKLA